jgi:hypothetical protein
MKDSLEELKFNVDTMLYLKDLGWSNTKTMGYFINNLNYPSGAVTVLLNTKLSYLNSVMKRLDLYVELGLSHNDVKLHMSKYSNLKPLVEYLLDTSTVADTTNVVKVTKEVVKTKELKKEEVVEEVDEEVEEVDEEVDDEVDALDDGVEENDDDEEANLFDDFLKDHVDQTNDDSDKMKSSQVYSKFKSWYSSQYDEDVPSKAELKSFLNDKFGKSVKSAWKGVSLK